MSKYVWVDSCVQNTFWTREDFWAASSLGAGGLGVAGTTLTSTRSGMRSDGDAVEFDEQDDKVLIELVEHEDSDEDDVESELVEDDSEVKLAELMEGLNAGTGRAVGRHSNNG